VIKNKNYDEIRELISLIKRTATDRNLNVWTWRVATDADYDWKYIAELCNSDLLIAAFHKDINGLDLDDLVKYLKNCKNGFASIKISDIKSTDKTINAFAYLIRCISREDFARLGFVIGDFIETPYFPLATSFREGFSVALRYVDILRSNESRKWLKEAINYINKLNEDLEYVSSVSGIKFLGFDLSLSPWMSESVVEVIEKITGTVFASPGTASGVFKLNQLINEIASETSIRTLGFNEVMLPVGEDSLLMRRVREGSVTLKDLSFLSSYCLAGVDMVAIRPDPIKIRGIISDLIAASTLKGRPLGFRAIPAGNVNEVYIRKFGSIPVID
jgi:hypothetical protein